MSVKESSVSRITKNLPARDKKKNGEQRAGSVRAASELHDLRGLPAASYKTHKHIKLGNFGAEYGTGASTSPVDGFIQKLKPDVKRDVAPAAILSEEQRKLNASSRELAQRTDYAAYRRKVLQSIVHAASEQSDNYSRSEWFKFSSDRLSDLCTEITFKLPGEISFAVDCDEDSMMLIITNNESHYYVLISSCGSHESECFTIGSLSGQKIFFGQQVSPAGIDLIRAFMRL